MMAYIFTITMFLHIFIRPILWYYRISRTLWCYNNITAETGVHLPDPWKANPCQVGNSTGFSRAFSRGGCSLAANSLRIWHSAGSLHIYFAPGAARKKGVKESYPSKEPPRGATPPPLPWKTLANIRGLSMNNITREVSADLIICVCWDDISDINAHK